MSQKVITIHTLTSNYATSRDKFQEQTYPELQKFLDDGYFVKQVVPVTLGSTSAHGYSLTFILDKL